MELTAKEAAVRDLVLKEIQHPSFAEKKHLVEELDHEWIVGEIDKMERKGRLLPWFLIVVGVVVTIMWVATAVIKDEALTSGIHNIILAAYTFTVFVGGGLVMRYTRAKRLFLLRILSVIGARKAWVERRQPSLSGA